MLCCFIMQLLCSFLSLKWHKILIFYEMYFALQACSIKWLRLHCGITSLMQLINVTLRESQLRRKTRTEYTKSHSPGACCVSDCWCVALLSECGDILIGRKGWRRFMIAYVGLLQKPASLPRVQRALFWAVRFAWFCCLFYIYDLGVLAV